MNFPQLCYQFKDLVAFSVAEFEFDKNQAKPCWGFSFYQQKFCVSKAYLKAKIRPIFALLNRRQMSDIIEVYLNSAFTYSQVPNQRVYLLNYSMFSS